MIHIDIERKMLTSEGERKLEVEINIPSNQLICLYGKSGSGKTTLLRLLSGLTKPDKGIITIGETVVFDSFKKINLTPQLRKVGFMFQDYALFPNMSVEENIRFAQPAKKPRDVQVLMEVFGLEALHKQRPHQLSGGQKQRVALARALAGKPEVLLLDEPLSAVDYDLRLSLQREIQKAHELLGTTTLLVSHDKDEIKRLANQVLPLTETKTSAFLNPTFL